MSLRTRYFISHGREVPQEDLKDVFRYCDVPTRCKLRRVSKYWKHLTNQPDISEVVLVNPLCRRIPNKELSDVFRGDPNPDHSFVRQGFGWHYLDQHFHELLFAPPDYHRRHGILGPHVRVMIYDGSLVTYLNRKYCKDSCGRFVDQDFAEPYSAIYSIGYYCSNLQQIMLCHVNVGHIDARFDFNSGNSFRSSRQLGLDPNIPALDAQVTFVDSTVYRGCLRLPVLDAAGQYSLRRVCPVKCSLHYRSFPGHYCRPPWPIRGYCDKEEYAWVAKHAPRLPELYHQWAQSGIYLYCMIVAMTGVFQKFFPAVNLNEINSHTVTDHDLLQILTFCIRFENLPNTEAPPSSLDVWDVLLPTGFFK